MNGIASVLGTRLAELVLRYREKTDREYYPGQLTAKKWIKGISAMAAISVSELPGLLVRRDAWIDQRFEFSRQRSGPVKKYCDNVPISLRNMVTALTAGCGRRRTRLVKQGNRLIGSQKWILL